LEEEDQVKIRFKNLWKNGTTGVVLRPEVFLLRLAGLMLPSGVNAVRYHRAFAPAFVDRERVVPAQREEVGAKKPSRWTSCRQEMTVVATLQGILRETGRNRRTGVEMQDVRGLRGGEVCVEPGRRVDLGVVMGTRGPMRLVGLS
jgi:hypothetical protein